MIEPLSEIFSSEGYSYRHIPRDTAFYLESHRRSHHHRMVNLGQQPGISDLTILIATLPERKAFLSVLCDELSRQGLQFLWNDDPTLTIGAKRNVLIETVTTPYLAFVDDDDWVSAEFGPALAQALAGQPDVDSVVYDVVYVCDNQEPKLIQVGRQFEGWATEGAVLTRQFLPWMPLKTEIARRHPFDDLLHWGEDRVWVPQVTQAIQSQVRLERILYAYEFRRDFSATNKSDYVKAFYQRYPAA
jgi:hypothetical protein